MVRLCLGVLAGLVSRAPFGWLRALGAPLAWLVGSILRVRRAHVQASLARAGLGEPRRTARAMYRSLGASVMELLWLARRPTSALTAVCALDPASRRLLSDALADGKGAVLAASHTGNWELAACAMASELDLLVVVKPISLRGVDDFMTAARASHGVGLAPPEGALVPARQTLARGGCVAMLIDQAPERGGGGIAVDFLGAAGAADRAPAALSACTGAPLVVVAFRRKESGEHRIHVLRVLRPPRRDRRAWIEPATREATRALDGFVREHPSQWLWLHRRWKIVSGASCKTPSSSPGARSRVASSSGPASSRTSPRPRTPSTARAPRSSRSPSGVSI
jgi:Kdo2-lipid IVA lauroyltransferase/acyltransferase